MTLSLVIIEKKGYLNTRYEGYQGLFVKDGTLCYKPEENSNFCYEIGSGKNFEYANELVHRAYFEGGTRGIKLYNQVHKDRNREEKSLGTLGGGNHFIEANKDNEGNIYIVIHSGSRHLGLEVANYYQNEGYKELNGSAQKDIDLLIKDLKAHGKQKEIQKSITTLKNTKRTNIPKQLAYVKGELFSQYIHDMKIVQTYAELNRQAMIDEIVSGMNLHIIDQFTTIHNYIDTDSMILRKGAVSAKKNEKLLIPINMRDGSLICIGKGNFDWNESAPHGAGRLMSRSAAKERYTVSEFKKQMEGIFTTSVNRNTLDECPMAYKNLDDIVNNISDTVVIDKIIKPIYNFKAGGD